MKDATSTDFLIRKQGTVMLAWSFGDMSYNNEKYRS